MLKKIWSRIRTCKLGWFLIATCLMIPPLVMTFFTWRYTEEVVTSQTNTFLWGGLVRVALANMGLCGMADPTLKLHEVELMPTFLSMLAACGLFSVLVIRGVLRPFQYKRTLILLAMDLFILESLTQLFLGAENLRLFGISLGISPQAMVVIVIVLAMLSMKTVAGYAILILLILGIHRLSIVNIAMGGYGSLYMLCVYLSFAVQFFCIPELNLARGGFAALKEDFGSFRAFTQANVNAALSHSTKVTKQVADVVSKEVNERLSVIKQKKAEESACVCEVEFES